MLNAFDPQAAPDLPPDEADLLARRRRVLGDLYPLFYREPIRVVRGEGAHLFDARGTDYLDCYNNVAVVGHANPAVRAAVSDQLGLADTHTRYLQSEVVDYAERLITGFDAGIDRVAFTNSGSEANDLAIRMARVATGRRGVIVTGNAYHGVTDLIASLSPSFGTAQPLAPFVRTVPVDDLLGGDPNTAVPALLDRFEQAHRSLSAAGYGLSAVLIDQILSSDGIFPGPVGWLGAISSWAHEQGGLYVADEVQSGFARTGDSFWGYQRHGAQPDLVTMGKPMGNGVPVGGVAYRSPIGEAFGATSRYFNTFGGNPVSMRAAAAVLDEIDRLGLQEHCRVTGADLVSGLRSALDGADFCGTIRGAGLFIGVEITDADGRPAPAAASGIVNALRDKQVLISLSGVGGNVLKIRPPLVFTASDTDRLLSAVWELRADGAFG